MFFTYVRENRSPRCGRTPDRSAPLGDGQAAGRLRRGRPGRDGPPDVRARRRRRPDPAVARPRDPPAANRPGGRRRHGLPGPAGRAAGVARRHRGTAMAGAGPARKTALTRRPVVAGRALLYAFEAGTGNSGGRCGSPRTRSASRVALFRMNGRGVHGPSMRMKPARAVSPPTSSRCATFHYPEWLLGPPVSAIAKSDQPPFHTPHDGIIVNFTRGTTWGHEFHCQTTRSTQAGKPHIYPG